MALTKPILSNVPAWDVTVGQTFTFNVVGGDQVVGSSLYILNNATGTVVYSRTITSFKYEITVPPNAVGLVNGVYYRAYVETTDVNGNVSVPSNSIQFYCYATPTWSFTNVSEGSVINNSNFIPEVSYNQTQSEPLASYRIALYNAFQTEIASSGVQYVSTSTVPISVAYAFSGLSDNTVYYVKAFGQTINDTVIETDFVRFIVQYSAPAVFSRFFLSNNCKEGYITYTSNTALIEGKSQPSPPTYIGDEKVDLTEEGDWVRWDDGFIVGGDFTIKAWIEQPNDNSPLITLTNLEGQQMQIGYYEDLANTNKVYADFYAEGYYIFTPSITKPTSSQQLCIQLRRIRNVYELKMEVV